MSKRRLNKQQQRRVHKIQQQFQCAAPSDAHSGRVMIRFGKRAEIESPDGKRVLCSIRPNIDSLVAGDEVRWLEENNNEGMVVSRQIRKTALIRHSKLGGEKVVAANASQMLIMLAPMPVPSLYLIDSYLVAAETLHLKPVLVVNKTDLECDTLMQTLHRIYDPLDYPIFRLHKEDQTLLDTLALFISKDINVVVGQSGVGKSSLVSRLLPEDTTVLTGELSTLSKLGKHTTSHSRFYHLPQGGALIDSPGVREFNMGLMDKNTVLQGFKELAPLVSHCKYRNCDHQSSPNCAVLAAVEEKKVQQQRYASFCKLWLS